MVRLYTPRAPRQVTDLYKDAQLGGFSFKLKGERRGCWVAAWIPDLCVKRL